MYSSTHALNRGEWTALRSGRFTPGERASSIRWIGDLAFSEPIWTRRTNETCITSETSDLGHVTEERLFYLLGSFHDALLIFISPSSYCASSLNHTDVQRLHNLTKYFELYTCVTYIPVI